MNVFGQPPCLTQTPCSVTPRSTAPPHQPSLFGLPSPAENTHDREFMQNVEYHLSANALVEPVRMQRVLDIIHEHYTRALAARIQALRDAEGARVFSQPVFVGQPQFPFANARSQQDVGDLALAKKKIDRLEAALKESEEKHMKTLHETNALLVNSMISVSESTVAMADVFKRITGAAQYTTTNTQ